MVNDIIAHLNNVYLLTFVIMNSQTLVVINLVSRHSPCPDSVG